MNAWYFTFEFPPDFGGGLSTYMRYIAEGYASRKDDFLVVFTLSRSQSGLISSRYLHDNVLLIAINPLKAVETEELGYWVNVSRLFERHADYLMSQIASGALDIPPPDYLEFADGFGIGTLTIQQKLCLNSRLRDVPVIVNAHTPTHIIDRMNQQPVFRLPTYWHGQMELQALAGADLVLAPSQAILDLLAPELARTGARMRRTAVMHNPYRSPEGPPKDHAKPKDHFYMASRLAHWKGAENAIRAMERLWAAGSKVPLLIYGDDSFFNVSNTRYSEYLTRRFAAHFDNGLVQLMGKVPRDEIDARAETAYAQLHPSHFDNFPYSLVEALGAGTICVAGTHGGIKEIAAHGKEIFLADVQDPAEFAGALEQVMALSPAERRQIAGNAVNAVRTACDVETYFERKHELVRSLRAPVLATDTSPRRAFPFLSPPDPSCVFAAAAPAPDGPELSVVIPYFNMGSFIDETLQSITACTTRALEIVLVDDGSTDPGSRERLLHLHEDHGLSQETLRIVTVPNGGVANARNTGVRMARGPFVTLLDADDLVTPRYYEKALRVLKAYDNVSFVGAWIEDYNQAGRIRNWATWNAEPPIQLIMNQTNCQSLVYKREAFERDGMHDPDLRMFLDDWDGVIALLAGGHRGVMIPEPLFLYRIRTGSIFRSNHNLWDLNYEKITTKHRALYNEWGAEVAAFLNANGPNNFCHVAGKASTLRK